MGMSTTPYEKDFIRRHLRSTGARRLLEIGAYKGATTRVLFDAAFHHDGQLIVIDPMTWRSEAIRNGLARHFRTISIAAWNKIERLLPRASYEPDFWENVGTEDQGRLHLYRARSTDEELLKRSDSQLRDFDFAFVDGDHSYLGAKSDLMHWGSRVLKGGWVFVHDAIPSFGGVMDAIREWTSSGVKAKIHWPERDSICAIEIVQ